MPRFLHAFPLFFLSFVPNSLLLGCDPSLEVAGGSVFPEQPPPEKPYLCGSSAAASCQAPRHRVWLPGWYVIESAARGDKVAFAAYPCFPHGGPNSGEPIHLGQLSLDKGTLDWITPIGSVQGDVYSIYDLTLAPSGDVLVGFSGYGELLTGTKVGQFDGFIASFDSAGKKRFAHRLEISDGEILPHERPQLINVKIIANENTYVHTGWHVTPSNQPTKVPLVLFSFSPSGTRLWRQEVPFSQATYSGHMWAVPDGTMWSKSFPGPFRRYSKTGEMMDTFELLPNAEMRGFAATGPKTVLVNLTTKGMTNEMYRMDLGTPMTPLFAENTFPEIHAAEIVQSQSLDRTYMVSLAYTGLSHRIQSIETNGNRGSAITVQNVRSRFTILDEEEAVLARNTDFGTEFIVQPL